MKLVIYGRPTTKKNSSRVVTVGRTHKIPKVLPSKAYCEYEKEALLQLLPYRKRRLSGTVKVSCKYYMPDKRSSPDLVGLLQATSDVLEKANIIDNDKYITSYDGSCIVGIDRQSPRVEIEIEPSQSDYWKGR